MTTIAQPLPRRAHAPAIGTAFGSIGAWILRILVAVLVAMIAIPVPLLFLVTAVPLYLAIPLALCDAGLLVALAALRRTRLVVAAFFAGVIAVSLVAVWLSQIFAYTPPITDAKGGALPNSIAVMETIRLNGTDQWVTIRGKDQGNPVLLFLAGGPGGSELAHIRNQMPALEDHFVVVNWDPANAGKSYGVLPYSDLTIDRVVSDAHELTLRLRERFADDKIFLFGESGGTVIGVKLIQRYPELYAAWIGTGQRTIVHEDDLMGYDFALRYAAERGDTATVQTLRQNGPPPYHGLEHVLEERAVPHGLEQVRRGQFTTRGHRS